MNLLKRLASHLTPDAQWSIRRRRYARQLQNHTFTTPEPEYACLSDWLHPGDWAIDIGANIGHYTNRLSTLVGPTGRVFAFEPVPETFSLLAANARHFPHPNVTLFNAAASDAMTLASIAIPRFDTGLANYYEAELTTVAPSSDTTLPVLTLPLDALPFPHPVTLVKIDAENHEFPVLRGMQTLLRRDHPLLIVETGRADVIDFLTSLSYTVLRLPSSPNIIFLPQKT